MKKVLLLVLISGFTFILGACSPKITSPNLGKLEAREAVLVLNTQLNKLNLALEREKLSLGALENEVKKANDKASQSASDSKSLSNKLSDNPGDLGLSSRAEKAAKRASRDAQKAGKLNDSLGKSNKKIEQYQKDIESTKEKLKELEGKIEFVPNN
ncbi:hypothetical protein [Pedobacter cryophilus]|uniref:SlyB protein n=1 Tax=Pedobacter cryophilus TaxID=2571271 RepID=A0A4U1C6F1_9SPHI|nr:hypothetical protein [Pedobacter cryophilus]TKC01043.1 hypothetical protein FA046_05035 [Pedobacter cryophilus]